MVTPTYPWTPEMDAKLTRLYRTATNRVELTEGIARLVDELKRPRYIINNRTVVLGLRFSTQRPWTAEEIAMLREWAGDMSLAKIARRLKRSKASVKHKASSLQLSCQVTDGFSRRELADLMGVNHHRVATWISRGWLVTFGDRIPHDSVARFLWNHMQEYRLASCDDWWLKTMLKPQIGVFDNEKQAHTF